MATTTTTSTCGTATKTPKFVSNLNARKTNDHDYYDNNTSSDSDGDQNIIDDDVIELHEKIKSLKTMYMNTLYKPAEAQRIRILINAKLCEINNLSVKIHKDVKTDTTMSLDEKKRIYDELKLALDELRKVSTSFNSKYKQEAVRIIKLMDDNIDVDEQTIDTTVINQYMQQSLIQSDRQKHDKEVHSLIHLKENQRDIQVLETAIIELHQIFIDFSLLVESQDQHLDKTVQNMEDVQVYVEAGVKELEKGAKYKSKERKKCCCLATCGLVTVVAAGLGAGATVARGACSLQ